MQRLTLNIVLMLHERSLELFGCASGIRNQAGLEAAIAKKRTLKGELARLFQQLTS